jgi:hypothetical protein
MNDKQKQNIVIVVLATVVVYVLFIMFTKKSEFNPARYRSGAQYASNQALAQKKNEIRDAMRRSRQGGAEGAAGAARFSEIQNLVKKGDREWKQALTEVFEGK